MKTRCFIGLGSLLILLATPQVSADDDIKTFVDAAGKIIFTNLADKQNGLETAVRSTRKIPPPTRGESQRVGTLDGLIHSIAIKHQVDPHLVRAVIQIESHFDRHAVSPQGAMGLMQLIPETGKRFGVRDFFDPAQNIEGGVRYLRVLLDMFEGKLDLSLAAYNSGENRVTRLGRIPRIAETQNYVKKVQKAYQKIRAQAQYKSGQGFESQNQLTNSNRNIQNSDKAIKISPLSTIRRIVDEHGVRHFYNVAPRQ